MRPAKTFSTAFILLGILVSIQAQTDYVARLLIPYNDHGQWGYCDTLGKLRIEPRFAEAGFFTKVRIGGEQLYMAKVQTAHGTNYLNEQGALLFPTEVDVRQKVELSPAIGHGYLAARAAKLGIYRAGLDWLTEPTYDTISWQAHLRGLLLLKQNSSATYDQIDNYTGKATPTDITQLREYYHNGSIALLAERIDGDYVEVIDGMLMERSPEQLIDYEILDGEVFEEMAESPAPIYHSYRQWRGPAPEPVKLGIDSLIDTRDLTTLAATVRYGFQKLIIGVRDGKQGVVNEAGETILPFEYDSVKFMPNGSQAHLAKDGKYGYKLFLCPYPTIEPVYEQITLAQMLYVKGTWSFAVFGVELAGQAGFVGENGFQYFDFD